MRTERVFYLLAAAVLTLGIIVSLFFISGEPEASRCLSVSFPCDPLPPEVPGTRMVVVFLSAMAALILFAIGAVMSGSGDQAGD